MNRKNLSRGKLLGSKEWVEGFYVHLYDDRGNESHRIYTGYAETDCSDFYPDWGEVDPSTVSRCTGLTDKNGKKIFEGDIIQGKGHKRKTDLFVIRWSAPCCGFTAGGGKRMWPNLNQATVDSYEVVGNVYDNPELLEVHDEVN